jgi:hypothetical protein
VSISALFEVTSAAMAKMMETTTLTEQFIPHFTPAAMEAIPIAPFPQFLRTWLFNQSNDKVCDAENN